MLFREVDGWLFHSPAPLAPRSPPMATDRTALRTELMRALLTDVIGGEADAGSAEAVILPRDPAKVSRQREQRTSAVHWVIMLSPLGLAIIIVAMIASLVTVVAYVDWRIVASPQLFDRLPAGIKVALPSGGTLGVGALGIRWWRKRRKTT